MDDEARFRQLFEATYGVVRRYAHHRDASEGLADDIVAQTFLVAWDDLTPAQAATVLGCSPGAARLRLHRARGRLAAELAKRSSAGGQIGSEEPIEPGARP